MSNNRSHVKQPAINSSDCFRFRMPPSGQIPPCKSACLDPLPVPEDKSGLKLTAFLPVSSDIPSERRDPFAHYQTMKSFQEGDRFVFECDNGDNMGVFGGQLFGISRKQCHKEIGMKIQVHQTLFLILVDIYFYGDLKLMV